MNDFIFRMRQVFEALAEGVRIFAAIATTVVPIAFGVIAGNALANRMIPVVTFNPLGVRVYCMILCAFVARLVMVNFLRMWRNGGDFNDGEDS